MEDLNREGLCMNVDFSPPVPRIIRALNLVIEWRGKLAAIRCDYGSE
jgi:putative transposase